MYSKAAILAVVVAAVMVFPGFAFASPPVPPPTEGFVITTAVDCEMSAGDFSEAESFTWTWMHDPVIPLPTASNLDDNHVGKPLLESTLGFPGTDQHLGEFGRAAQIRYTEEMQSTDTSFLQFKKGFAAGSENDPNVTVERNYGYVASEASLIANAENKERVGLSIVANGDALVRVGGLGNGNGNGLRFLGQGLGDMPSLCPWAHGAEIPATNEFIAMGSDTATTSIMVSDTETSVVATRAPEMDHSISAVGVGMAQGLMKVALMEGGEAYLPFIDADPPNLVSKTDYSETTRSSGTIEKFSKVMHYHSTIPAYQMPEPWYELQ